MHPPEDFAGSRSPVQVLSQVIFRGRCLICRQRVGQTDKKGLIRLVLAFEARSLAERNR
jgi:hypothetical protein